jgi:hypothetical protein
VQKENTYQYIGETKKGGEQMNPVAVVVAAVAAVTVGVGAIIKKRKK